MKRIVAALGVLSLAWLVAPLRPCLAQDREPPSPAKVVTREGRIHIAEVLDEEEGTLRLLDLKTGAEISIAADAILDISRQVTDEEAIKWAGLAPVLAWRVKQAQESVPTGQVANVTPTAVYVNLGTRDGMEVGEKLKVYREGEVVTDPETGEVLGEVRSLIAELEVTEVQEKFSKAKRVSDMETVLQRGDTAELVRAEKAVAVLPLAVTGDGLESTALAQGQEWSAALVRLGVPVVERVELGAALAELGLQSTTAFDPDTVARLGKLVGAHAVLTGTVGLGEPGHASVHARLLRVRTGEVVVAVGQDIRVLGRDRAVGVAPAPVLSRADVVGYAWVTAAGARKGNVYIRGDGAFMCDSGQLVKDVDYWCNSTRDKANRWDRCKWEVTPEGLALTFWVGRWMFVPGADGALHGRYVGGNPEGRGQTARLVPLDTARHSAFVAAVLSEQAQLP